MGAAVLALVARSRRSEPLLDERSFSLPLAATKSIKGKAFSREPFVAEPMGMTPVNTFRIDETIPLINFRMPFFCRSLAAS